MRRLSSAALLGALLVSGCATEVSNDDTTSSSTASGGGEGGSGGAGGTGGGGAPASTSSTGGAGGAGGSACAQDCSAIDVPECFQAVCNEQTGNCDVGPAPDDSPCEDGAFCTVDDTCSGGVCQPGGPRDCTGGNADPCAIPACDEDGDSCSTSPAPNGTLCVSADVCLSNTQCFNGQCLGAPKDCSAAPVPDECHVAVCDPMQNGACVPVPGNDGLACDSFGDLCMVDKVCSAGQCVGGTPKNCSAFTNGCNNGLCDAMTGDCYSDPVGPGGNCLEATDACNQGICDMNGNCLPTPVNDGGTCSDGSSCTINDVCSAGTCTGMPDPGYTIYFSEGFASNAAGWTLGTQWGIGPATASSGQVYGNPDPADDHTATADDGVAGVVIGGNAATSVHGYYYLESPIINTASAPGSVYLEFWRWLNSDYTPYMQNVVEVYNGSAWVVVWQSGSSPGVQDAAWTKQSYDITAYKNAGMRVRFGFQIGSSGVFTVSSWNIDDVTVASAPCN